MKYVVVDRFTRLEKGRVALAVKNVTGGEEFLGMGLAGGAVMPASVIVETMAQVAGILVSVSYEFEGKAVLAKVERAEFFRPLTTGDHLEIEARMGERRDTSCHLDVEITVDGTRVARMSALFACLPLSASEGRMFNTRQYHQERADLLRVLGVFDLIGDVPAHVEAPWTQPPEPAGIRRVSGADGSARAVDTGKSSGDDGEGRCDHDDAQN